MDRSSNPGPGFVPRCFASWWGYVLMIIQKKKNVKTYKKNALELPSHFWKWTELKHMDPVVFTRQLITQKSTKNQKMKYLLQHFVTEHLLNITSQSSYKYLMYFWQSLRETASYHLVRNTCWKRKEFMDIQYQCHSRSETSKNILFNWGKHIEYLTWNN